MKTNTDYTIKDGKHEGNNILAVVVSLLLGVIIGYADE
jgi:hypothetical protein